MARPYTSDRAYRSSVLPLGVFMVFGGIVLPVSAVLMPAEQIFVPPLTDPWLTRVVFGGMSLFLLPLGVGFCLRSKVAWYGFFAWALIGTIWWGVFFRGPPDRHFEIFVNVVCPLFNLLIAVGIYFATKPVFVRDGENGTVRRQSHLRRPIPESGEKSSPPNTA